MNEDDMPNEGSGPPRAGPDRSLSARLAGALRRLLSHNAFSSLTKRILFLNLAALVVLVSGILYMNQFRDGLIDARVESLMTQGEIIAGAIASSANVETDTIRVNPEDLLTLQAGQSIAPNAGELDNLDFPINPERVAPLLRRLISPTRTRARIFDREANILIDSRHLYSGGQILRYDLPPPEGQETGLFDRFSGWFYGLFADRDLVVQTEQPGGSGAIYPEVMTALTGSAAVGERLTATGESVVSVAVPVQRYRAILGVLMLSTEGGDIDRIVAAERRAIFRVFGVAAMVTAILSMLLASTIARPLRRLSEAAVRVRRGVKTRVEIPDFSERQDEIGHLSVAIRDMTNALYARIEAIESFAADVAHELKNPLTSLRSAVETLPLARSDETRKRLLDVIQHDVRRLDRLITDISDASRLDAEMVREDAAPLDVKRLVSDIVAISTDSSRHRKKVRVDMRVARNADDGKGCVILGHESRLGQVLVNLIENARSFVPDEDGRIVITLSRAGKKVVITVDDNGPGIKAENIDRIFERFYTDRPANEAFGQNSGLGLSISRQIVEAHGGTLTAENIAGAKPGDVRGARFVIALPGETG
ncbi:MAG: sensor histidine kinase [Phyllobacteriaceae bacterium]|nr:sensor histidine kinase [Phyllobacteriaceae bacterium]